MLPVVLFSHVTRGEGPRLGRRLLGSSRPSTPEGFALWGVAGGDLLGHFCSAGGSVLTECPRPKYSLWRGRSFLGFQQVLSGPLASRVRDCGPQRPPRDDPSLRVTSGPRAFRVTPLRCPGAPGLWAGRERSMREDVLPGSLGRFGKPLVRSVKFSLAASQS